MADGSQQGEQPRVLVVDDDPYLRMLLSIEVPEIDVLESSTMGEAFEVAVAERPDAILVDRTLTDGDGLELVGRLRAHAPLRETPIMLITAGHDEGDRASVLQAGADEYLSKPLEAADLLARLHRILSLSPEARTSRRATLLDRIRAEPGGDPDPPGPDERARARPDGGGDEDPPKGLLRRLLGR